MIKEFPEARPRPADVLIVLDDTVAMASHQDLVAALPALITKAIHRTSSGWLDLRIAVTSNDGRLRHLPGVAEPYLMHSVDLDFTEHQNYPGTLEDALAQLVDVGATNDGPNQPLEAMRRALEHDSQFLREPAPFSLIIIGASDDASPLPTEDYVEWTKRLTRGTWWRPFEIGGIYPKGSPRLDAYAAALWGNLIVPIDGGDAATALLAVGGLHWWAGGAPCMEEVPADRDPSTPEVEPDCTMSVLVDGELRSLPQCTAAAPVDDRSDAAATSLLPSAPCWRIGVDRQNCTVGNHLDWHLGGYTDFTHPALRFECRVK